MLAHRTTIEDYFRTKLPATIKEAAAKIYELTGIQRSESRIHALLKRIGIERRKVGHIPAKADVEAQEAFKKKELQPHITQTQAGQRFLFFVDAAHFVLAPFWGLFGR